jgi:2-methylcitrate dehydratase
MSKSPEHGADQPADSIQARLTRYAAELTYDDLPGEVVHAAKVRIIDTLGALVAGFDGEPCRIARALASEMPLATGATILGTRTRTTVDMAAFVNATTARFPELTDTYHWPGSAYGHPSDVITPLVSVSEQAQAAGRDLIASVVLAYEVFCRFSDVFHNRGFDPSNFACVAIAVGAGKLLGLPSKALSHCIAMAVTPNIILRQVRLDHLSMFKVAAAGQAARAGVFAALLAKGGMEGPHLPFEGRAGWCKHVAGEPLALESFGGRGVAFRIPVTGLKMRPCAGNTISSVLAAEKAATFENSAQIARVTVEVYDRAKIASGTGEHFWNPQSAETADHSIPYLVAMALIDGTVTPRSYDDARLRDPQVRGLIRKIEVVENEEFTRAYGQVPQMHRTRVTVTMESGEKRVGDSGGSDDDLAAPKTDAQVEAKFRGLAGSALGTTRVNEVLYTLWRLENLKNAAKLPSAFVMS